MIDARMVRLDRALRAEALPLVSTRKLADRFEVQLQDGATGEQIARAAALAARAWSAEETDEERVERLLSEVPLRRVVRALIARGVLTAEDLVE